MLCQRGSLSVSRRSYCSRYRTLRVALFNNWGQLNFLFLTNLHSVPKEDFNKIGPQKTRRMNFQTIHAFKKKNLSRIVAYTAMDVRLLRTRKSGTAQLGIEASSLQVSTRMSGMACGTHSDLERSRFGGQNPTADGL